MAVDLRSESGPCQLFLCWQTAGSRSLFRMQRLLCARVLLQINGASCSRSAQMLAPAARGFWTRLSSGPRWLCSPAPQRNSSRDHAGQEDADPLQDKSIGLIQRYKKTFKQYGKVMIPVHLLTSTVWFGTFYYAAMK